MFILLLLPLVVALGYYVLWHAFQRYLLYTATDAFDLAQLRLPRREGKSIPGNAVICGGSIAGLLAAQVCSRHFDHVVIVEPEAWLVTEDAKRVDGYNQRATRARVMQYTSLQGVIDDLTRGMEALFPNLEEECKKSSIKLLPAEYRTSLSGSQFRSPWKYLQDLKRVPKLIFAGRRGLETFIRRLVLSPANTNIEQKIGLVIGITRSTADPSKISSVSVRANDGSTSDIPTSLLIDCTGITRAAPKWLSRAGFTTKPLPTFSIDQKLHYSSMIFRVPPELDVRLPYPKEVRDMGSQAIYGFIEGSPENGTCFFDIQADDGNLLTLFVGQSRETTPSWKTLDDYIDFARALVHDTTPIPEWVFEMLEMLKEVPPEDFTISQLRILPSTYVCYHQVDELPSNFAALGDSVMSLNPTKGQGTGKAMYGAIALDVTLRGTSGSGNVFPRGFSKSFFKNLHDRTGPYWEGMRIVDYGIPCVVPMEGDTHAHGAWLRAYIKQFMWLGTEDEWVSSIMTKSAHRLGTPIEMFNPALVRKVVWRVVTRWMAGKKL